MQLLSSIVGAKRRLIPKLLMKKLSKLELIVDPLTGQKSHPQSISAMAGGTVSAYQKRAVLKEIGAGKRFPSQIVIEGLSLSAPGQQALLLCLEQFANAGLIQFKGSKGWSLTSAGIAELEDTV